MALQGFEYNTSAKDIVWNKDSGSPKILELDEKVCRDLIEVMWVETDLHDMIGTLNISTLVRVQDAAQRAKALYANRQATQNDLDPREQIVNFDISGIDQQPSGKTEFAWKSKVTFKGSNEVNVTF